MEIVLEVVVWLIVLSVEVLVAVRSVAFTLVAEEGLMSSIGLEFSFFGEVVFKAFAVSKRFALAAVIERLLI